MKTKSLLLISLLAGSLLFTSCDALNKTKKKLDDDETTLKGYQGKQGATELSEAEWKLAFSLEELALRRNCHLKVTQESVLEMDIDNSKWKVDVPYYDDPMYFKFKSVSKSGLLSGTYYYPYDEGVYKSNEDEEQLDLTMAREFGIMYLNYADFTFDSIDEVYRSDNFNYKVNFQGQTVVNMTVSNCEVVIQDGFPKYIDCDLTFADSTRATHYLAEFTNYNRVTVTLPNQNNGNKNNSSSNIIGGSSTSHVALEKPAGTKITYSELYRAFQNRQIGNFNYATIDVYIDAGAQGKNSGNATASLVNGEWVLSAGGEQTNVDFASFIMTEAMMQDLNNPSDYPDGVTPEYYYNASTNQYIICVSYGYQGDYISTNMYLNSYFYVVRDEVLVNGIYEELIISWYYR